jgi:two-component system OmpR family response regulator
MSKHILVVDDEARIREVLLYALQKDGFRVTAVADGPSAIAAVEDGGVDLVVLDVMLPEIDGLEVCRRIRQKHRVPILFLSARGEEVDRIVGLELGGDDYLTKPFSPRELTARVRAVFRRTESTAADPAPPTPKPSVLQHGDIEIDTERHEVRFAGNLVALTPTEFGVLGALLERPGVVLSRGQLMQRAYRYDNLITERTIDTHVRRIRAKFRAAGGDPIATVHGVGYKAAGA